MAVVHIKASCEQDGEGAPKAKQSVRPRNPNSTPLRKIESPHTAGHATGKHGLQLRDNPSVSSRAREREVREAMKTQVATLQDFVRALLDLWQCSTVNTRSEPMPCFDRKGGSPARAGGCSGEA